MKVEAKDIDMVASLSRLRLDEAEKAEAGEQLDKFLTYVENLQGVKTEGIEPTTYALPMQNVFRADEVKASLSQEAALSNAPEREDGYFKVPRVLES